MAALIGGAVSYILGGFDNMLFILVILSVIDYISGILAAAYLQKVDFQIGYKGILKKIGIYCVVAVAVAKNVITAEQYQEITGEAYLAV